LVILGAYAYGFFSYIGYVRNRWEEMPTAARLWAVFLPTPLLAFIAWVLLVG
jgi:hypothetical protein